MADDLSDDPGENFIKLKRPEINPHGFSVDRFLRGLEEPRTGRKLKSIKGRVLRKSKDLNRRLSRWNARTFQFMLEYKLKVTRITN